MTDRSAAAPTSGLSADTASSLDASLARVGDRWSLLVVAALLDGPLRFTDLSHAVSGIAPNILTERLRRLERAGVVAATPYSRRPLRHEYRLTEDGTELGSVLRLLAGWGSQGAGADAPRHAACGTAVETRWYCPTCARLVREADGSDLVRL